MNSVGEIISTNRKRLGWSQAELAAHLQKEGFNQTGKAISKWEKNNTEPSVTIFLTLCRIMGVTDIYEEYFGVNPNNPLCKLNNVGREKALDYIELLHDSGKYENHVCEIIPFVRDLDIFDNAVSAGLGNFLTDELKTTVTVDTSLIPEDTSYGVRICGDSMEPEFFDGQIAFVTKQEILEDGEIGIFGLNNEAYIKRLKKYADKVFLISLNEKYSPIEVKESDRFDVFGKVIGKADAKDIPGCK